MLIGNASADVGVFGSSRFGSAQWAEPLDTDNDGVSDSNDAFPTDPSETSDFDLDGSGIFNIFCGFFVGYLCT